jgi:RP/EB family microtubule-associated protein
MLIQLLLQLQLTKIEQCATGSVYCQIMDAIYPGSFNLSKVKWGAKFDYEFVENYKVLQSSFDKNGIKKHIEVDKLVKAKYQDNLEFCQWIKRYFDLNYSGEPYNALQRRKGNNIFYIMGGNKVAPPSHKQAAMNAGSGKTYSGKPSGASSGSVGVPAARKFGGGGGDGGASAEALKKADEKVAELQLNNETLDREREFYFGKLRDIEEML